MDTKLLKQKILDLAIRGKLVPQDPNDEPASILLEKIRKEKQELIKQGKIKKDKNESTIFVGDDKQHYEKMIEEQPLNWTVIRLNEVLYYEQPTNYIVTNTEYCDSYKTPVLTAGKSFILGYTNEATGIYNNLPCIIFDDFTTDSKFVDFPFKVKSSAMKILTNNKYVSLKFIYYSMQTIDCIVDTHKRFWISDYSNKPVYLPPLAEQQKIVEKIEELFAQVDKIEEEKQSLLKLIDKAKDKVLDLAMKGKLVKQDPNDEPASVLLEKIFEEKKKLAKEGKIKLSKDELLEPQISDDNDYYRQFIEPKLILKYPKVDNWNKLTLNQICISISTKEYQIKSSEIKSIGQYPVISQGEQFIDGYCETTKYLDKIPCIIFGDHTRVVKYIDFPFVVGADGTKCLYPYINHKFFYFLIKYYSSFIKNRGYARHFSYLSSFIFYIHSSFKIQEQISAQVENLLNKIEQIKDSL